MSQPPAANEEKFVRGLSLLDSTMLVAGTIIGIFVLRRKRSDAERPYKAFGYPIVPALYIIGASVILVVLFIYQTATTWPGLIIVLTGVPIYFLWRKSNAPSGDQST